MERRKRSIETPQRIVSMISNLYPLFLAHLLVDEGKSWFDFDARRFGASSSSFVNTCTGKRGGRSTVRDCTRSQITDIRPINDVLPSMPSIIRLRAISRVIACTMNRSLLKKKSGKIILQIALRHDCEIDEGENIFFSGGELAVD